MTTTYYAICNVNGPISVRLQAGSIEAAHKEIETIDFPSAIDTAETDAEDDLDINGADEMDEAQFAEALRAAGAQEVEALDVGGRDNNPVRDGWMLWEHTAGETRAQVVTGGRTHDIHRCVTARHPDAVHAALGTNSEEELQAMLDQCNVEDWYKNGRHLGPDENGLVMFAG